MALRIDYLDDERDLTELFTGLFASPARCIRTFNDPATAVKAIAADPPDVLFIDYRLPGVTGDRIAQALDPALPKVLVTGELSVDCGNVFVAVFTKPIPVDAVEAFLVAFEDR